ncbi:MAG: hypothetical protein KC656_02890 [Myxococcales bacterium]|nr:hypothetical protein [Myxococcales bacterium]
MIRWAPMIALTIPTLASAGTFDFTTVAGGPVDVSITTYSWDLDNDGGPDFTSSSPVTFTFNTPTLTGSTEPLCQLPGASAYCFSGLFSTSNKGYGTFTSTLSLDPTVGTCTGGTNSAHPFPLGPFLARTATCPMIQEITATFADTGASYVFEGTVNGVTFTQVRLLRSGVFYTFGANGSPTIASATFGSDTFQGDMTGILPGFGFVPGTFQE